MRAMLTQAEPQTTAAALPLLLLLPRWARTKPSRWRWPPNSTPAVGVAASAPMTLAWTTTTCLSASGFVRTWRIAAAIPSLDATTPRLTANMFSMSLTMVTINAIRLEGGVILTRASAALTASGTLAPMSKFTRPTGGSFNTILGMVIPMMAMPALSRCRRPMANTALAPRSGTLRSPPGTMTTTSRATGSLMRSRSSPFARTSTLRIWWATLAITTVWMVWASR
mmetsp:Transcript_14884/g.37697  ORF Transcript_14884/g.37697 Transcript_14884/m.37697 type:complete len:225 (-) Transcript_14884:555-1229(-)